MRQKDKLVLVIEQLEERIAPGGIPTDHEKCNSGRGNGSETTPADDCDPGNSGGHNNGGD